MRINKFREGPTIQRQPQSKTQDENGQVHTSECWGIHGIIQGTQGKK